MTAQDTVSVSSNGGEGHHSSGRSDVTELTMPAGASTAAKIRALRVVRREAPDASYEISDNGARFTFASGSLTRVKEQLAGAGLIDLPTPPAIPRMSRSDWLAAAALAILAFYVRLNGLGPRALWLDDAWVGLSARLPWSAIREVGLTAIGFTSLVKIVGGIFGPSSLAFQALPLLFGIATPVMVVVLFRRWLGVWPAVSVGLMAALSPVAVTFSTRVKQYSFDAFCTVGLLALTLHLVEKPEDRRRWIRFAAAAILAGIGSSILLVIVAACGATVGAVTLVRRRHVLRETLMWGAVIGMFTLLYWQAVLGENVNAGVRRYWSPRYVKTEGGISGLLGSVGENLNDALDAAVPLPSPAWAWLFFGAALITMCVRRWHVALLCILPLLITIVLSVMEYTPLGGGRTDTHVITALFILAGFAINEWATLAAVAVNHSRQALVVGLSLLVMVPTLASVETAEPYPEQDIRTLVEVLETNRRGDDRVLLYYASIWAYAIYTDVDVELVQPDPNLGLSLYNVGFDDDELVLLGNRRAAPEEYSDFVSTAVADGDRVWFISSHSKTTDLDAIAAAFIDEGYLLERSEASAGAELTLWVPPPN